MVLTLYVIGNGFYLHHGIESGYWRFGEYLKANDAATFEVVERYFELDGGFRSDFEARA
ncbi:AbiH family protein [Mesorhizobium sp. M00.F.Ca.ET.217.01.1.1]|uniref:AbiH family protein n=1 Tax=Mesorhizobium sp. M00.F.Ca.ET.217.01.1.1 TaxID=2500529 RepID=UPI000FD9EF24|nr:AbiH family protein [Mesorhizobium sp. M00.F.Ca.ET.217.01.1.1]TGV85452.1 hypothetical protein EN801_029325 [Mesorhizobium sp. M00.F.Ca.ET.158.01.1.1]